MLSMLHSFFRLLLLFHISINNIKIMFLKAEISNHRKFIESVFYIHTFRFNVDVVTKNDLLRNREFITLYITRIGLVTSIEIFEHCKVFLINGLVCVKNVLAHKKASIQFIVMPKRRLCFNGATGKIMF